MDAAYAAMLHCMKGIRVFVLETSVRTAIRDLISEYGHLGMGLPEKSAARCRTGQRQKTEPLRY